MTTFFLLIIRLVPLFLILWSGFYLHIGGGGIFKSFNRALWPMLEFSLRLSRRLNPRPTSNIDATAPLPGANHALTRVQRFTRPPLATLFFYLLFILFTYISY